MTDLDKQRITDRKRQERHRIARRADGERPLWIMLSKEANEALSELKAKYGTSREVINRSLVLAYKLDQTR